MADILNLTTAFSALDITSEAVALDYTNSSGAVQFCLPSFRMDSLNAAAADITVKVKIPTGGGKYNVIYDETFTKDAADCSSFVWTWPDAPIPIWGATAIKRHLVVTLHSTNANDTSVPGYVWLRSDSPGNAYLLDTVALAGGSTTTVSLAAGINGTDAYKNHYVEVVDADTGLGQIRMVISQANVTLTLDRALSFTPASGDVVKIMRTAYGDIGTINGSTPMSTADIKTAMEADGGTLDRVDDLTKAAGDGDLAAILEDTGTTLENRQITIAGDVENIDGKVPAEAGDAMTLVADQEVNTTKIAGVAVDTAVAQIGVNVVSEDNIDFGALKKTSLNNATPSVTVSDKTGFSLSTAGILAIWHQATAAISSGIGSLFKTNIDTTISSRATSAKQDTMETTLNAAATEAKQDTMQTDVDAIQAQTDLLEFNSDGEVLATNDDVSGLDTKLDTIIEDVAGLNGDVMRGTNDAATEAKQDTIDGKIDLLTPVSPVNVVSETTTITSK